MRKYLFIILFELFAWTSWGRAVDYQEGTIDFTKNVDLKMVFDGGLRPTQIPGLETTGCQVENVKVRIVFPEKRTVNILVERGDFSVDADGNITSINFYGPFQPINDAIDQAEAICQVLSLDRGDLENIRTNPGSWDHPNHSGWGGDFNTEDHRTQFVLRPRYHYKENGADIVFDYRWHHPSKLVKMRTSPIEPPTGYENFSMKPPQWHPTGPAFPPLSFEQAKAVAEKKYQEIKDNEKTQSPLPTQPLSPRAPQVQLASETGTPWWLYGIVVVSIVAIISAAYYLSRRDDKGP